MNHKISKMKNLTVWALALLAVGCNQSDEVSTTVKQVTDQLVTRIYESYSPAQMDTLSHGFVLSLLSEQEKKTLAENYWIFEVNVPVTVSLMRHTDQKDIPFWLPDAGFKKTELIVKNEMYTYEVWQKDVPAGRVNLGINGFDKHRPVYFVSLKPQSEGDSLTIRPVFPEKQHVEEMGVGAFTYHDWDGLKLSDVPEPLLGGKLLTTIRGRAREAHLVKAFRDTPYPSSELPDQIVLTWSSDPTKSQDIQWRTNAQVSGSYVQYWKQGSQDTIEVVSTPYLMEDRLLRNDRFVYRHTGKLQALTPGTLYQYRLGSNATGWTAPFTFTTAPEKAERFSYIWFGDTHYSPLFGDMLQKSFVRHPEVGFYQIAGDLVSTGLHRDDWDKLWGYSGKVLANKSLMTVPGNHDSQDGLGAWMYKEMFSYPENGPAGMPSEMTYSYEYGNALFLMIDATQPLKAQTAWIEDQLQRTTADWKLVMFHFPPYNFVEPYPEIIAEWGPVFDKHHVDIVMGGHMHYYLRTKPIYADKTVDDFSKGTVYMMSISIEGKQEEWPEEPYAVIRYPGGPLYQHVTIEGRTLRLICYDPQGNIKDQMSIEKK